MRTARTLIATAAVAAMIPAAAFADGESPTYPQELADASLAAASVTGSSHEVCFSVEWIVTAEGVSQPTQPDFACATSTTTTESASSSTTGRLLSAVAQLTKLSPGQCVVTADGRFTTSRALGSDETTHRNGVIWKSSCAPLDTDPTDDEAPACVEQSAEADALVIDQGLWGSGAPRVGTGNGHDAECGDLSMRAQLSTPLVVPILGYNNVHGTGSPLEFASTFHLSADGVGSHTLCVTAMGRQDVELVGDSIC